MAVTSTEQFVFELCQRSFLSPWCYCNPKGKDGDELCDILVVCDPNILIISVKGSGYKDTGIPTLDIARWERKALQKSLKQIRGAERWLKTATQVIRCDGTPGIELPFVSDRRVHRISVMFGVNDAEGLTIPSGNFDVGFVNVMTDQSVNEIFTELDTITDFIQYLEAKESRLANGTSAIIIGSESNLLGWYLQNGRSFQSGLTAMLVDDTIWEGLQSKPEFKRRKEADRESYVWDRLIEILSPEHTKNENGPGPTPSSCEQALLVMARESRLARRILGRCVREFMNQGGSIRSRLIGMSGGVPYVFVHYRPDEARDHRETDLVNRCLVAKAQVPSSNFIIGVGVDVLDTFTVAYLDVTQWSVEDTERVQQMQNDLGYFKGSSLQEIHEVEYPDENAGDEGND